MVNLVLHANFRSPLLWDITAVTVYLTASCLYLYLALIPDIALLRDGAGSNKLRWLYQTLSLGWNASEKQQRRLNKFLSFMAVAVVMIAVSVHTVVSFVFVMTLQPMWHSGLLAPYFVAGAIFSGIASLILAMAIIRKYYHLENYFKPIIFNNLGLFLLVMALFWFYFTMVEYITAFYGDEPFEMTIFWYKLAGSFAPYFWGMFILCFVIPVCILATKRTRTILGTCIASISVVLGMWVERYTIIIPTLTSQRLTLEPILYIPTWVEWSILAGCTCLMIILYMVFTKIFPVISISEIKEGREKKQAEVVEWVDSKLPGKGAELEKELR